GAARARRPGRARPGGARRPARDLHRPPRGALLAAPRRAQRLAAAGAVGARLRVADRGAAGRSPLVEPAGEGQPDAEPDHRETAGAADEPEPRGRGGEPRPYGARREAPGA